MKRMLKSFILGAALALCGSGALANDSVFGGVGSNLIPIQNDEIRMLDEHVILQQTDDGWHVEVTFHFRNETNQKQKLLIGFPFKDIPAPYNVQYAMHEHLAKNFKATVRGKPVETRKIDVQYGKASFAKQGVVGPELPLCTFARVWEVEFAPNEQLEIFNSYDQGRSYSPFGTEFVYYVLLTGKNWKGGKIGRSLLEVRFDDDVILASEFYQKPDRCNEEWDWYRCLFVIKPDSPPGYRVEGEGKNRRVIWDLKDFAPEQDLVLSFAPRYSYLARHFLKESEYYPNEENSGGKSCKDLSILRHTYYAFAGYPFQDAELRAYFEKQPWYKPDPEFDLKKMPALKQKWLKTLEERVEKLQKARGCKI